MVVSPYCYFSLQLIITSFPKPSQAGISTINIFVLAQGDLEQSGGFGYYYTGVVHLDAISIDVDINSGQGGGISDLKVRLNVFSRWREYYYGTTVFFFSSSSSSSSSFYMEPPHKIETVMEYLTQGITVLITLTPGALKKVIVQLVHNRSLLLLIIGLGIRQGNRGAR